MGCHCCPRQSPANAQWSLGDNYAHLLAPQVGSLGACTILVFGDPGGDESQIAGSDLLNYSLFIGFVSFLPHVLTFPAHAPLDNLPNKPFSSKSLSQSLFLGESNPRHMARETWAFLAKTPGFKNSGPYG